MYDKILVEIQGVDPSSGASSVAPQRHEAFLRSWLKQYPRKPKSLEMDRVARSAALLLAKGDIVAAVTLLYSHASVKVSVIGSLTPDAFLNRKFYLDVSSTGIKIHALKHWKKIVHGAHGMPISALILLYEAAQIEVKAFEGPEWIHIEALGSLNDCFDLTLPDARAFILQRKNRLAALMLDPSTVALPQMQLFWQSYQAFYQAESLEASLQTSLTVLPKMGLPETLSEPREIALPENPSVAELVAFKKAKVKELDDARAQQAWACVDKTSNHPREQFWRTLYPHLKGVYLGSTDSDWPDYGEALIMGDQLINYRKLALMAQHRDVCKLLMGRNPSTVSDSVLGEAFVKMPGFRALSFDEQHRLAQFNADDTLFWHTLNTNEYGKNAYEYFSRLLVVLDTYRVADGRNLRLESDMNEAGLNAIRPFLVFFHQSNLAGLLSHSRDKLPREATDLRDHLTMLANVGRRMMVYHDSCFNQAYRDIHSALNAVEAILTNDVTFEEPPCVIWKDGLQRNAARLPLFHHDAVIQTCLAAITHHDVLLAWTRAEAAQGTALLLQSAGDRFIALLSHCTAAQVYNFVMSEIPQDGQVLFSDQIGQENGLAFTRHAFLKKLFPAGIELSRLESVLDLTCAMRLHVEYGVSGIEETIKHAIKKLLETDRYKEKGGIYFGEVSRLLVLLISHAKREDIKCLTSQVYINNFRSSFLSFFENDRFDRFVAYYLDIDKPPRSRFRHVFSKNSNDDEDIERQSENAQIGARNILEVLIRSEHNAKKILITLDYYFSLVQGGYGRCEEFDRWLKAWLNTLSWLTWRDKMVAETIILVCMASYESSELKEHRFAESLGFALQSACLHSDVHGTIADIHAIAIAEPQLELDVIDTKMNCFRKLFKEINNPAALNALLKASPKEVFEDIIEGKFKLIEAIKNIDDLITVLDKQESQAAILNAMKNIPFMNGAENLIKIWPYLKCGHAATSMLRAAQKSTHKPTLKDVIVLAKSTGMHHDKLYDYFIDPKTEEHVNTSLNALDEPDQRVYIGLLLYPEGSFRQLKLFSWLNDTQLDIAIEIMINKKPDMHTSYPWELDNKLLLKIYQKVISLQPAAMTRLWFKMMNNLQNSPEKYKLYEAFIPWAIVHNPKFFYNDEPRISPQFLIYYPDLPKEVRTTILTALVKHPGWLSSLTWFDLLWHNSADAGFIMSAMSRAQIKSLFKDARNNFHLLIMIESFEERRRIISIFLPDQLCAMQPAEVADTFLGPDAAFRTDYQVCLGDYFERFQAIYQLLVSESPGGSLFHQEGMAALSDLDPYDAKGWSAVLKSPDMKEGSLRLLAWNIAIKEHAEDREHAVTCALSSRRIANVFFSQQNTWQPSEELRARIKVACDSRTDYNRNSLLAKMY